MAFGAVLWCDWPCYTLRVRRLPVQKRESLLLCYSRNTGLYWLGWVPTTWLRLCSVHVSWDFAAASRFDKRLFSWLGSLHHGSLVKGLQIDALSRVVIWWSSCWCRCWCGSLWLCLFDNEVSFCLFMMGDSFLLISVELWCLVWQSSLYRWCLRR